jgi:tetratricopeptide (TPR) repeat protein
MVELLIIIAFAGLAYYYGAVRVPRPSEPAVSKTGEHLGKLWQVTHESIRERRFLRAEKALLTILKLDEKNAAAYNRLGILYAKQKEYRDAIDCFEIASSLDVSASSLHNLGLIYYETEHYEKAAIAFEQALKLEDSMANRHVAYAKVQEKLDNGKLMLKHLELAAELEPTKQTLSLLRDGYLSQNQTNAADATDERLKKLIVPSGRAAQPKHIRHHPRVVA